MSHHSPDHSFDRHLDHCSTCRDNPLQLCQDGVTSLTETVESGEASDYDRLLHEKYQDRD